MKFRFFHILSCALALLSAALWALPPGNEEEIRQRIAPIGTLCKQGEDCAGPGIVAPGIATQTGAGVGALTPVGVYDQFCSVCHAAGVAGAPLFGDKAIWEERLTQGLEVLYGSTINGKLAMPIKGTCMTCSDDDLRATVDYMLISAEVQ